MDTFTRISVQKAHEIIGADNPVTIVDVRDVDSFNQGHIAHAYNLNNENINHFISSTDREIPVVCYCYHGISSQSAASYLADQGFKQVYSIDGGWEEWKKVYGSTTLSTGS